MNTLQVSDHRAGPADPTGTQAKCVLFIGLSYYSYTDRIAAALRARGFAVKYYPAEKRSFWWKAARKLLPSIYRSLLGKYHARIVSAERGSRYDYVFFLQIHNLALDRVESLRQAHPSAKFILYNWDSLHTHDYRPYLGFSTRYLRSTATTRLLRGRGTCRYSRCRNISPRRARAVDRRTIYISWVRSVRWNDLRRYRNSTTTAGSRRSASPSICIVARQFC